MRHRVLRASLRAYPRELRERDGDELAVTAWSASAQPDRVEEESFSCVDGCADVERQVAEREDAGWACAEVEDDAATTWRCTLD
jgi:hypothetical protein